jgi:hypothetical protein
MENESCCSLERCMSDCRVVLPLESVAVGRTVNFSNGTFCEVDFYVHDFNESLRTFGRLGFVNGATGQETKLSVSRGPSENFYG